MGPPTTGGAELAGLRRSTTHLADLVAPLDDATVQSRAYPTEWTIADVMSHVGSSGEIMRRTLTDGRAGAGIADDFAPGVWDVWNAKVPRAQVEDALRADRELLDAFEQVPEDQRTEIRFPFGPMEVGFAEAVGFRLNEHVLHTWDIEVALDPDATLQPATVPLVVDNLEVIAGFTGRPTGATRTIGVRTTEPVRVFVVRLEPGSATLDVGDAGTPTDLRLPAEAWIRLVYGRLDPDHTPTGATGSDALDELRRVYTGV